MTCVTLQKLNDYEMEHFIIRASFEKCGITSLGEMCHTLYLCLYFILEGLGLGFNLKLSDNYSKIIEGPGVAAVALGFWR